MTKVFHFYVDFKAHTSRLHSDDYGATSMAELVLAAATAAGTTLADAAV
jgi:hypothetical protein